MSKTFQALRPTGWGLVLGAVVGLVGSGSAQEPRRAASRFFPDSSHTAQTLLRAAAGQASQAQWAETLDLYQRVIQEFGGTVALVPAEEGPPGLQQASQLYVDVREECHRRLAALPPEALALYRRRVDPQAERLYREGLAIRDEDRLRRVVEEMFCSSWGDDALLVLGDWAFRAGRVGEALSYYERIVPPADAAAGARTTVPDADVDRAAVAARIVLCRVTRGDATAGAALAEFARLYPEAKGSLAGRTGSLTTALAAALEQDGLAIAPPVDGRWSTFAGSPSRTRIAASPIDVGSFQWKVRLEPVTPLRPAGAFGRPMQAATLRPERGLAYYPIVLGDHVVLCDAGRLFAYNLNDRPGSGAASEAAGGIKIAWDQPISGNPEARPARPAFGVPRFTVSGQGDRIFARLGPLGARMGASHLIAVQNNRDVDGKLLWRRASTDLALPQRKGAAGGRFAAFEGTPVADDRNVYIALTEPANMTALYVACLDARTGATRWIRFLGEATSDFNMNPGMILNDDTGNRLLTLESGTIYYQTNLGVLAALEAETGAIRWLASYPQREGRGDLAMADRDLNPAVAAGGLVFIAPSDCSGILAFEASSGRLRWRNESISDISHVLGVSHDRLIVTGSHVYFLDVATGRTLGYWPQGAAGYVGYGRGVLAGDFVYWPTRSEIHVLEAATGLKADRGSIPLQQAFGTTGGNLAVGDGYLVIAQEDALVVFCQNSRLIDRLRETIAAAPDAATHRLRLARVAEATGQEELALESLSAAIEKARPGEMLEGQPLADLAYAQRFRILMRAGDRSAKDEAWDDAASRYEAAGEAARTDRDRLAATLLLADSRDHQRRPSESVALLQGLLSQDRLRTLSVAADERRTVRADLLIGDRLEALLRRHGRALYGDYEADAERLLKRGRAEHDPRLLDEIGHQYPAARLVPDSLLELGTQLEGLQKPVDAARAYKRLLASPRAGDTHRAQALLGLGRTYEAQGYWIPARDVLARARSRHGELRLEAHGRTVSQLVSERLGRPPFDRMTADMDEPALDPPLERRWGIRWSAPARPIGVEGVPPSDATGRIFLVEGTSLRPIDPTTGHYAWTTELGGEAVWAGYLSDRVVVATERRMMALDARTGVSRWALEAGDTQAGRRPADPFTPPPPALEAAGGALADFRIVGGRVFCRRGSRELIAVDGDTGLIDWSFAPAQGTLNPHYTVNPQRVLVQVVDPKAVVVLEAATGLRRHEFPVPETDQPWSRDPLPTDDEHVAVVTDPRTVALLDLTTGGYNWIYREPSALPRSGPPRLLGDAGCLLVLRDGSEVVRLDPANGNKLWSRVIGVEDLSERPAALALDGNRLYCATGRNLTAYALADGAPVWRRHLTGPPGGWSLALALHCIAAYPNSSRSVATDAGDGLPLILCRRDSGALVQRLYFPEPPTELTIRFSPGSAVVVTQQGGWALSGRRFMDATEGQR